MFTGFQPSGYQNNAYQIVIAFDAKSQTGGGGRPSGYENSNLYERSKFEYYERQRLEEQKAKLDADLKAKDWTIDELEARRLRKLDDYRMQRELMALLRERQELINQQLLLEQMLLIFRNQQNAIIALLLSSPF